MLNLVYSDKPDVAGYAKNIKSTGTSVLVDYNKYYSLVNKYTSLYLTAYEECTELIKLFSVGKYTSISSDAMLYTLEFCCNVDSSKLQVYKRGEGKRYSLDQQKVLKPLYEELEKRIASGTYPISVSYAHRLLSSYLNYKQYKTWIESAKAKIKRFSSEIYEGAAAPCKKIDFYYEEQSTGRFYTKEDNLQAWSLQFVPSITVDKGYFMFWCDFAQIDFRIAYHTLLREPGSKMDAIYLAEPDKYKAMYTMMCSETGSTPDYDMFKTYRKGYKKGVLSGIYNATEKSLIEDVKNVTLGKQLKAYYDKNERYQYFRRVIDRVIDFDVDVTVRDYFGYERTIPVPGKDQPWLRNDVVSKCCNTPIQATTNSILILWLEALLSRFESLGYSRETDVVPYLIRHDECIFKVRQEVFKDIWVFNDFMKIALDDWDVLELEPHIGFYYKEPVEALEDMYKQVCEANKEKITPRLSIAPRSVEYRPISDVLEVYCYAFATPSRVAALAKASPDNPFELPDLAEVSEEDALGILKLFAESDKPCSYRKTCGDYLRFSNVWVVKSNKLNQYKQVTSLQEVLHIASVMQTSYILCHTVMTGNLCMYEDFKIRIEHSNPDTVQKVLDKAVTVEQGRWFSV